MYIDSHASGRSFKVSTQSFSRKDLSMSGSARFLVYFPEQVGTKPFSFQKITQEVMYRADVALNSNHLITFDLINKSNVKFEMQRPKHTQWSI